MGIPNTSQDQRASQGRSGKIKLEVSDTERYPTLIVPNPKTETSTPGEE